MPGIVLYAGTESRLPHHLHIEIGPLRNALGLNELVLSLEELHLGLQFLLNIVAGSDALRVRHPVGL